MASRARATARHMTELPGPRVAAVVLAAGTSSRYRAEAEAGATTKLVADLDGKPLVRHVVEAALASRAAPVVVVTGHANEQVRAALAGLPTTFIHNADFATGLASSLKAGVAALTDDADGAIILLGDMPRIEPNLIDRLIADFADHRDARAVAPLYAGERGNPALVSRAMFADIAVLTGDQGARKLFAGGSVVDVPVDDEAVTIDVDTPGKLAELRGRPIR